MRTAAREPTPTRAVVIGAGTMGRRHVQSLRRTGAVVTGVADLDRAAAERLATRAGRETRSFDVAEACIEQCDADVVHVCTPAATHVPLVRLALEHGRHVLVEKPLAASVAETQELLSAARQAGVRLNPVHQFPFQRGVQALAGRPDLLGDLVSVAWRTSSAGGAGRPPEARRSLLLEILPHAASLFHRFAPGFDAAGFEVAAQPEDVRLVGRHDGVLLEALVTLRGRPPRNELHLVGTRASAVADLFHGFSVLDRGAATGRGKALRPLAFGLGMTYEAASNGLLRVARLEPAYPGLRELVRRFHASVAAGTPPPVSDEETLAAATLVETAAAVAAG